MVMAEPEQVRMQVETPRGVELFSFLKCPVCLALLDPTDRAVHQRSLHTPSDYVTRDQLTRALESQGRALLEQVRHLLRTARVAMFIEAD